MQRQLYPMGASRPMAPAAPRPISSQPSRPMSSSQPSRPSTGAQSKPGQMSQMSGSKKSSFLYELYFGSDKLSVWAWIFTICLIMFIYSKATGGEQEESYDKEDKKDKS